MRVFAALEVPAEVAREIGRSAKRLRAELPRGRWVREESLHVTVAFVGESSGEEVKELAKALAGPFARGLPARITLVGGGFFPARGRPRAGWIGIRPTRRLQGLYREVRATLDRVRGSSAGDAGAYRPHLTLVRPKETWRAASRARFREELEGLRQSWTSERGVLLESVLGRGPARYRLLAELPGKGGGG